MIKVSYPDCAGFSLIETMVAAVILGIAITGVMSMLPIGATFEVENGLRRQAMACASDKIEQIKYHNSNFATLVEEEDRDRISHPILKTSGNKIVTATMITEVLANTSQEVPLRDGNEDENIRIRYKEIVVKISWAFNGPSEYITLRKSISEPP